MLNFEYLITPLPNRNTFLSEDADDYVPLFLNFLMYYM